jgi:hypothetical protein
MPLDLIHSADSSVVTRVVYFPVGLWFDKLTTNGLRLTMSGIIPFVLSLSKGFAIALRLT